MMKPDINVFLMNLPGKKNEVIIENEDGSYTIVIDDQLSQEGKLLSIWPCISPYRKQSL